MIHASKYQPRIFPLYGGGAPAEIDRAQSIDPTATLNREKVNEIGREDAVGYSKQSPSISYRLAQLEYGSMEFWRKLTNQADSVDTIDLDDFKTPTFDICAYATDDDGTFRGTIVYPKLRTESFTLTIGDPNAIAERSFDLVGEEAFSLQDGAKYYIYAEHTALSGSDDEIDLSTRVPALDPDVDAGEAEEVKYIYRVVRVPGTGTAEELTATTDYTYSDATKILTINSITTDDLIKVYYFSATAPATLFTENDTDPVAIRADSASIYLYIPASSSPSSSDYLYRLQSVTIDVSFEREDVKEIGNKRVVQRGINEKTVTITLGRILEEFTLEEVLRGEGTGYDKIDVEKFTDQAVLIVKFFEDNDKTTFKYGLKATGLSPTEVRGTIATNSYVNRENAIEGEALVISTEISELGI